MIKKLFTSNYNKDSKSNVSRVIKIINEELKEIKNVYNTIEDYNDIDNIQGLSLEIEGANLNQSRGGSIDELYRFLIKAKQGAYNSVGSVDSVVGFLNFLFSENNIQIYIDELTQYPAVSISQIKLSQLNTLGLTPVQLFEIVEDIIAAGVYLESLILGGTFTYGDNTLVTSYEEGYGDDMTVGGSLGMVVYKNTDLIGSFEYANILSTSGVGYADVDMDTGGTLGFLYSSK